MDRLLEGPGLDAEDGDDQLVIKRVDYYFHHKVFRLDYSAPSVYLSREAWEAECKERMKERTSEDWFWEQVRWRAYWDDSETVVNTHPVVHIGADNKGFDQLLTPPGGANRDSHGSFPYSGLYKDVGPGGATEEIATHFDHRKFYAGSPQKQEERLQQWKRNGVVSLADSARIQILPDWERLHRPVREDAQVREDWAWLLLPIRFGYPASVSPFAGIVAHAETGNLAILGPAFSEGWNRDGASAGFSDYAPHKIPRLFPLGLQDAFRNSWGYFNVFAALSVLPPIDVAWRVVAAPFRAVFKDQSPTSYPEEQVPYRFFGLTAGVGTQAVPSAFQELAIVEGTFEEILISIVDYQLTYGDSASVLVREEEFDDRATYPYYQLAFFIGKRFVSENVLRHSRSDLGFRLYWNDVTDPYEMRAQLNFWEYAGSVRYNLATGSVLPYGKLGYGLSHYRLENIAANGTPISDPDTDWITKWTWNLGAGLELMLIKSFAPPLRGMDLSLRIDWTMYVHDPGLNLGHQPIETLVVLGRGAEDFPRDRTIVRNEFRLGLTLSL